MTLLGYILAGLQVVSLVCVLAHVLFGRRRDPRFEDGRDIYRS